MNDSRRGLLRIRLQQMMAHGRRRAALLRAVLAPAMLGIVASAHAQSVPVTVGYRDFNFGSTVISTPTAEKPESKLWWNDGSWWGCLWNSSANKYRIHRFDRPTQSWVNVGPDVDDRSQTLADALWDGQHLYIASHIYGGRSQQSSNTTPANSARLYRYSYDPVTHTYSLDAGFPVLVNNAESETLVLDKDSSGQLWVTWTQAKKVYINRSLGDDLTWGTPFSLPTQGSSLDGDDISTIIAFGGNKIGVMWSNQIDLKVYFAVHFDSKADTDWEPREVALADPVLGAVADDHLNIKVMASANGELYAVTKTSLGGTTAPQIYLLKRTVSSVWSNYVVARHSDGYTRPIVILDEENLDLYVFANSGGKIRTKKVSLNNLSFPSGAGDVFIQSSSDNDINNPTASKHNVNSTTGLIVLASDAGSHNYLHNYIALTSNGQPFIASFTPTSGPEGTQVTITGSNFTGTTNVAFNGIPQGGTTSFTVDSNTQIRANVPVAATTGKISVTNSNGTAVSANDFTVTTIAQYTLTVNTVGSGSVALNPSGGVYDSGTMVTLTAIPASGFQFSGWSGDLSGSTNPATITMDANKNVTVTFTPSDPGEGGMIVHEETKTGGSTGSTSVSTSASLVGVSGHLYLAAISNRRNKSVTSVSGLGLSWTHVKTQCTTRGRLGLEVWMAQGTPTGNDVVTATFSSTPDNAAIAVSRYSGVNTANPVGNLISGNLNGVNGSCSGGSESSAYSFNLTTTTNGATVYGAIGMRQETHTPGTGYAERADFMQGSDSDAASIAAEDKNSVPAGTTIVDGSFSGAVYWAVIALELKPQSGGGPTQYTLTVNTSGSGSVTLNPPGGTYDAGTPVELTATPASGFQFSGWSEDLSGSTNPATVTMDANKNVTATFTAVPSTQFTLTTNTVGSGSVALNPSGGVYNSGTIVTLTATPASGYQFSGWSGDLSGSTNPATITMDANKNVTATFTAVPPTQFTLTTNTVGSGSVALNPSGGVYNSGTIVTLTATSASGYQFGGWSGDLSGSTNPATITMTANKSVTATFTASSGSGQVVFEEVKTGGSSSSTTVTTSASLTGVSGHLYLAAIAAKSNVAVSNVSGLGLTWTRVKAQCAGRNQTGVELWRAQGTSSGNGTVTATLASAPSNAVIAVSRYSGVDAVSPIGNVISGNTNGANGACSGGMDNASYSFNLTTTINGAMVFGAAAMRSHFHTPGAGYTERAEILQGSSSGSQASVAVQDKSVATAGTVAVNGSFDSTVDWAVVAVEVKPQLSMSKRSEMAANEVVVSDQLAVSSYQLEQNYPNPFWSAATSPARSGGNPSTMINLALPEAGKVRLNIFNETGQLVRTLVDHELGAGRHQVRWDGRNELGQSIAAGIYLYRIIVTGQNGATIFAETKRMLFLK